MFILNNGYIMVKELNQIAIIGELLVLKITTVHNSITEVKDAPPPP